MVSGLIGLQHNCHVKVGYQLPGEIGSVRGSVSIDLEMNKTKKCDPHVLL